MSNWGSYPNNTVYAIMYMSFGYDLLDDNVQTPNLVFLHAQQ